MPNSFRSESIGVSPDLLALGSAWPQALLYNDWVVKSPVLLSAALLGVVVISAQAPRPSQMNTIAERYVKLVLALGQHDADYVDAFYGPPEWKTEAERQKMPLIGIGASADRLIAEIPTCGATTSSGSWKRCVRESGCSRARS